MWCWSIGVHISHCVSFPSVCYAHVHAQPWTLLYFTALDFHYSQKIASPMYIVQMGETHRMPKDKGKQKCSIPWGVLCLIVDFRKTWCAVALLSVAPDCLCFNVLYDRGFFDGISWTPWKWSETLRILDPRFWDPGSIVGIFFHILVRWRTELSRTWRSRYKRSKLREK